MHRLHVALALIALSLPFSGCGDKPTPPSTVSVPSTLAPQPTPGAGSAVAPTSGSGSAAQGSAKPEIVYLAMVG